MPCGSAVYSISASPKLLGGNKYNYNREKETSCVTDDLQREAEKEQSIVRSASPQCLCLSEQTPSQPTK